MLWKFGSVYSAARLLNDHARDVEYALRLPEVPGAATTGRPSPARLYVHHPTAVAAG
jgi:hypothetical protein